MVASGMATWDKPAPEVSSAPPRVACAALAARKWLDGQISPPAPPAAPAAAHPCGGHPAAPHAAPCGAGGLAHTPAQHCAAWQPGLGSTFPSLACNFHRVDPSLIDQGHVRSKRLDCISAHHSDQAWCLRMPWQLGVGAHHGFQLALQRTSAENPLLLIETPVGGAGPSPTWNMDGPAPAQGARRALAASCPASPATAFLKAARPNTVCQAGLIRSARAGSGPQDASSRRQAKRQLFVQAADLAADLARLRKRIQDRLLQLPVCPGAEISPSLGCSTANSGAISPCKRLLQRHRDQPDSPPGRHVKL